MLSEVAQAFQFLNFLPDHCDAAQRQLQIFNIELKQKVASHLMDADVAFWKWIDESTIGIVTDTSVFHWNTTSSEAPAKIFDRHATLAGHQIINYRSTPDGKWLVLVGISSNAAPGAFKVKGSMQLYSRERSVSQPIEGHAASFAQIRLDGSPVDTHLFTFAVRNATGAKVCPALRLYRLGLVFKANIAL